MTFIESPPAASDAAHELVEGRFELIEVLKRGNGIDTYRGIDRLGGSEVVVKAIETASMPTAVYLRLQHEARLLERIDLGAARRVIWCGQRGRHFYVVQPCVPGEPLDHLLAAARSASRPRCSSQPACSPRCTTCTNSVSSTAT